jgi:hypothetical protein
MIDAKKLLPSRKALFYPINWPKSPYLRLKPLKANKASLIGHRAFIRESPYLTGEMTLRNGLY